MSGTIFGIPVVTSDDLGIELKEGSVIVDDWRKWAPTILCPHCKEAIIFIAELRRNFKGNQAVITCNECDGRIVLSSLKGFNTS